MTPEVEEHIALLAVQVLRNRFDSFPDDTALPIRNAPFHQAFLNTFRERLPSALDANALIGLSSWMHGLNTTLGQTFFEGTAQALSGGAKRSYKALPYHAAVVNDLINELAQRKRRPSAAAETARLQQARWDATSEKPESFDADVLIETGDQITMIELKTVKPNKGESRENKRKLLAARSALMRRYPQHNIAVYIGFPFDPTGSPADKGRFLASLVGGDHFFDPVEVLLADELWDFLSGERGTMGKLLDIIGAIAKPDFLENFEFINQAINRHTAPTRYRDILTRWRMITELRLMDSGQPIKPTQTLFDSSYKYKK